MCHRLKNSLILSTLAILCVYMSTQLAVAQDFERLPRTTERVAQLERLPRIDEGAVVGNGLSESNGTVRFAGGRIELQVPSGWWAEEVPFGRQVRLVLAPQRSANARKMPTDGMWIAYHVAASSERPNEEALVREFSTRLGGASQVQYSQPTSFRFGPWPAVVAEFTASDPSISNTPLTGRHVMVRTDWGLFEFHASAPDAIVESRGGIWTATWESLRLNPPTASNEPPASGASAVNTILGDWKSYRSRMHFGRDGRVIIVPDSSGDAQTSSPLTGTFDARDDLVFVRWDDGSRLNFRWRLEGNDLFLTDHEGQISHLKRVFN